MYVDKYRKNRVYGILFPDVIVVVVRRKLNTEIFDVECVEKRVICCLSSCTSVLLSRFLSCTCMEVSGVENIGQCGRLSQLSWLLGAL